MPHRGLLKRLTFVLRFNTVRVSCKKKEKKWIIWPTGREQIESYERENCLLRNFARSRRQTSQRPAFDKKAKETWKQVNYRIGGYRTPLSIRTPWGIFQEHNGHFWQLFIKNYCIFGRKFGKMTFVSSQKMLKINRTPAFYIHQYSKQLDFHYLSFYIIMCKMKLIWEGMT